MRPTRADLDQLIIKKGMRAATWYALRSSIRCLPVFGKNFSTPFWKQPPVNIIFKVFRGNALVFNKLTGNLSDSHINNMSKTIYANYEAKDCYTKETYAAYSASVNALATTNGNNGAIHAWSASNSEYIATGTSYSFAKADYEFLISSDRNIDDIQFEDLWWGHEPEKINSFNKSFCDILSTFNADYLFEDLYAIHRCSLKQLHIKKYLKNISENELKSFEDLKRLFLLEEATQDNYAVRILLLGPGGSGKTSLSQLLTQGKADNKTKPTIGINYQKHQSLDLSIHHSLINGFNQDEIELLKLYLWDFGGQAIFHSLHKAFMHENCVYILVVDSRHEQVPDEWLYQIKATTGNKGKVLIITNWFDRVMTQQNRTGLIRQFPQLLNENSFYDFSCIDGSEDNFATFVNQLISICLASKHEIFKQTQHAFDLLEHKYHDQKFITLDALENILEFEIEDVESNEVENLMNKLEEFGRYISVDHFGEDLCLKPEWIIDTTYQLLYSDLVQNLKGIVDYKTVKKLIKDTESETGLARKLLDFMIQQEVCIELPNIKNKKANKYFFPDSSSINEPVFIEHLLKSKKTILTYELSYTPIGLKAKLLNHLMQNDKIVLDLNIWVWRDGLIANLKGSDNHIIIEYQYRRQRIKLTLTSNPISQNNELLKIVDNALECCANREIIGYLTMDDSLNVEKLGLKKEDSNKFIIRENKQVTNNINIVDSNDSNIQLGDNVKYQSDNTDSFNTNSDSNNIMTLEQKEFVSEVINQLFKEVLSAKDNSEQLVVLSAANKGLENAKGNYPVTDNQSANSLLNIIWQGMKEIDSTASMAEKGVKYISPILTATMAFLSGV